MYAKHILIDLMRNSFKIILRVTKRNIFDEKSIKNVKNKENLLVFKI